jgi:predicted Zn finger-like uncharacterized protein
MMLTRCPSCGTTFRVTPDQLKARQGQVRCGKCRQVFDALRSLEDESTGPLTVVPADSPWSPVSLATEHDTGPDTEEPQQAADAAAIEPSSDFQPVFGHELALPQVPPPEPPPPDPESEFSLPVVAESADVEWTAEPEIELAPPPAPDPKPEPAFRAANKPEPEPEPLLEFADELPEPARRWPWVLGSVAAAVALAGQIILHYRVEIVTSAPNTRPAFAAGCELLGCQIPLPHKIDLIGIESSDLAPDKEKSGKLHLTATLRNRASFTQAWPNLEITLTDAQEHPLLRRSLPPTEYLPGTVTDGFPRRSEQMIQLALQTTDVPAVGYRLYVFYP